MLIADEERAEGIDRGVDLRRREPGERAGVAVERQGR